MKTLAGAIAALLLLVASGCAQNQPAQRAASADATPQANPVMEETASKTAHVPKILLHVSGMLKSKSGAT